MTDLTGESQTEKLYTRAFKEVAQLPDLRENKVHFVIK